MVVPGGPFICRQRLPALSRVNAGRDRMTTIRADGGAAAAERRQEDDCAEYGEKNASHNNLVTVFLTIRRQSRRWVPVAEIDTCREPSGCELTSEFAPVYFSSLVHRNLLYEINPLRHLPTG